MCVERIMLGLGGILYTFESRCNCTLLYVGQSRVVATQKPTNPLPNNKEDMYCIFYRFFLLLSHKNLLKARANDATEEDEGTLCNCMFKAFLIKINLEKQWAFN
jgi:hypothetical protein